MSDGQLYDELDQVDRLRAREGRGRRPEAQAVRAWCTKRKRQVRAELKRRGLATVRDDIWTGIGRGFVNGEVAG